MVIAFDGFKDEEYFVPKEIIQGAGFEAATVSNRKGTARGAEGGEAEVDLLLSELELSDYQGVVFIGGPGCLKNLDNQEFYQLVQAAVAQDKVLAAICISPVILAKAGALKGKKATVWSDSLNREPINQLKRAGAEYRSEPVVVDGKIITANGPAAAKEFGREIVKALKGLDKEGIV